MMNIKKTAFSLLMASMTTIGISNHTSASLVQGGRLVIYSQEEPKILDPLFNTSEEAKSVYNLIFSGLVKVSDDFDYYPDLAVVVPTRENRGVIDTSEGMIVTYKLKEMAFWHDGMPITADDVIFTWQAFTNPDIKKAQQEELEGYNKIFKIEAPDAKTVKIFFKENYPEYNKLFKYLLPKHGFTPKTLLAISPNHPFNFNPIGSGPFKFVEWKPGKRLIVDVNEKYYRARPHLDQIIYSYGKFDKNVATDLEKGKIHIFQTGSADQKTVLTSLKNINTLSVTSLSMEELAFNTTSKLLKDLNLRKAIAHSMNKDKIAENFPELQSTWSDSHPNSSIYESRYKDNYLYDTKMSQYLLDTSGWTVDETDGMRKDKDGQNLELNLITTDSKVHHAIADYMKENLSYLGVKLNVKVLNDVDFAKATVDPESYDIAVYNRNIAITGEDRTEFFSSKKFPPYGHNYSRLNDYNVDEILNNPARVNTTNSQKMVSNALRDELPVMPLFSYVKNIAVSNHLNNFRPNMINGNTWNSSEWWLN